MRIWVKEMKDTHLIKDVTIEDYSDDTRTIKIFHALEKACGEFDLGVPIWLKVNIDDFKRTAKARFSQDSFMEPIDFDYLELHLIEEDL